MAYGDWEPVTWDPNRFNKAREDSIGPKEEVNYEDTHKVSAKRLGQKMVTYFLLAAITVVCGVYMSDFARSQDVTEALGSYGDIVASETYRVNNNEDYAYDTYGIASKVLNSEDKDLAMYGVYHKIGNDSTEAKLNMQNIMNDINLIVSRDEQYSDFGTHEDFEAYIESRGFSSLKEYDKTMSETVLNNPVQEKGTGAKK